MIDDPDARRDRVHVLAVEADLHGEPAHLHPVAVDVLVITHEAPDHAGGAAAVDAAR